jgi:hypothetical protein
MACCWPYGKITVSGLAACPIAHLSARGGKPAKDVTAEVRLTGGGIKPAHSERLRQYLDLAKAAVGTDDGAE